MFQQKHASHESLQIENIYSQKGNLTIFYVFNTYIYKLCRFSLYFYLI
jgi:hypothetical protein